VLVVLVNDLSLLHVLVSTIRFGAPKIYRS
jgi:hypothetical protein